MKEKVNVLNYFKSFGFLFYFIVLFGERIQSIIRACLNVGTSLNNNAIEIYMFALTIAGIVIAFAYINKQFIYMIKCAFSLDKENYDMLDYKKLAIGSGIILFGGMVHTYETILVVQFVAYAGLIASMLMVTLENNKDKAIRWSLWLSFAMLVSFAMAVPVVYNKAQYLTLVKDATYTIYPESVVNFLNVYQPIASALLVIAFTMLLVKFYENKGIAPFSICVLALTLIFDLPIYILEQMHKNGNFFLIVFPILTVVTIVWGLIVSRKKSI